jgi:hypothetical protein
VDIVAAVEQGRYVSLDVVDTLSTFMVNDLPDSARFLKVAGSLVAAAAKASRGGAPVLQLVVSGLLTCGSKGRQMRRLRSNTYRTRSPRAATSIFCAGTY